jgi:hypothetical protein
MIAITNSLSARRSTLRIRSLPMRGPTRVLIPTDRSAFRFDSLLCRCGGHEG